MLLKCIKFDFDTFNLEAKTASKLNKNMKTGFGLKTGFTAKKEGLVNKRVFFKKATYTENEIISHVGKINIFLNIQKQNHEFQFYSPEQ